MQPRHAHCGGPIFRNRPPCRQAIPATPVSDSVPTFIWQLTDPPSNVQGWSSLRGQFPNWFGYSPRHFGGAFFIRFHTANTIELCGATVRPLTRRKKIQRGWEQLSELAFYIVTGIRLRANQVAEEFGRGGFMPSKLAISFLGMVVGGSAFMFAGVITFLTVNQLQDRQIQTTQVQTSPPVVQARFAQLSQ